MMVLLLMCGHVASSCLFLWLDIFLLGRQTFQPYTKRLAVIDLLLVNMCELWDLISLLGSEIRD